MGRFSVEPPSLGGDYLADYKLVIETEQETFEPVVLDGVKLELERRGSPSKLTFTVVKKGTFSFHEGSRVCFWYKNIPMFMGYVFTKTRDKQHNIEVTAYDQLRYLKNKFTYVFTNKKASEILRSVCSDYGLKVGNVEDTGYVIPSLVEDNQALFDIVLDALDETLTNTGKLYTLYDNFGSIELKELGNMKTNILIDDETAENFDYTSSIDSETYNKIVLYYVDEETNDRISFTAKDEGRIEDWGLLQYYEEVKTPSIGQAKANALLSLYNKKTRELSIKGAFGHPSVRAGSMVIVKLNLGDIVTSNYMVVEKVTHEFTNDHYIMELTINGNWGD